MTEEKLVMSLVQNVFKSSVEVQEYAKNVK